ncbi:CaiB/BaiF CoA transferase family protein [Lysinibacillus boronitolerans]|uniref:CoA-transferase n=1 Tax=Lysinibacillus boronitolerans JCM 21713 = 10a = NBRC 103108 TaxID=1294264 RepID=A0ABR4XYD9_9BACI|nr:CoA transferase [Lysinibacillus boronitolerans]KGR84711.1 CoA-transferase [Lysinibacillus boronitolerans JCM 21713 = 10a = NBRC 103108]
MKQALQGLKVVDLSQVLAGPYCTMVLADMGAEVIKIEKYPNGDDTRTMGPFVNEESHMYMMVNRNKKGVCINLKTTEGLALFKELIQSVDVLVENYRPGVTKKLGIDYDTLKAINPGLIYCSISGYGQTGPYSQKGGYDIMAQGLSGLMHMTGEADGRPVKVGFAVNDIAAAQTALQSILMAYIYKLRSGEGQYIDVSLVESGLAWTVWEAAAYFGQGELPERTGTAHRVSAPYQGFKTQDDYILVGAGNQKLWEIFAVKVVNRPDWLDNPLFATNYSRAQHVKELEAEIESELIKHKAIYWLELLDKHGVPSSPIYSYDQTLNDPHILERGMVLSYEHPTAGSMRTLGFPAKFSQTPGQLTNAAPTLGQHNEEILQALNISDQAIQQLKAAKIIGSK